MRKAPITTTSAESITEVVKNARGKGLPPVHLWTPDFCGDIDMRIASDGRWYYEGSRIERESLVRLFSTLLVREGHDYFLVTPVEKVGITVEDAPFVAIDFEAEGKAVAQQLVFETNVGDRFVAGPEHPIRVVCDLESGAPSPYVMVRAGLEALINRNSFYRLVDLGVHRDGWFGLWSDGVFFNIIPSGKMTG